MPFQCKASFNNASPIVTPRTGSPTPMNINAPQGGFGTSPNGNTLIAPANASRAKLVIRNESTVNDGRYGYSDDPLLLTTGFLLRATEGIDIEPGQTVYFAGVLGAVRVSFDDRLG